MSTAKRGLTMRRLTLALAALAAAGCGSDQPEDGGNSAAALRDAQIKAARGSAPEFPDLESALYCARFAAGASAPALEKSCNDAEANARKEAMAMTAPAITLSYCARTAEAAGGSYQILKMCIEKEKNAAAAP
jgi:hypothetical protein